MTKTKEELTTDYLYKLVRESCEFLMDGEIYRILGSNEDDIWTFVESEEDEYTWTYDELLKEIKMSDTPVEFFQLSRFAFVV